MCVLFFGGGLRLVIYYASIILAYVSFGPVKKIYLNENLVGIHSFLGGWGDAPLPSPSQVTLSTSIQNLCFNPVVYSCHNQNLLQTTPLLSPSHPLWLIEYILVSFYGISKKIRCSLSVGHSMVTTQLMWHPSNEWHLWTVVITKWTLKHFTTWTYSSCDVNMTCC